MANSRNRGSLTLIPFPKSVIVSFVCLLTLFFLLATGGQKVQAQTELPENSFTQETNRSDYPVRLRLAGVSSYELSEIFNDVVCRCPGVIDARRTFLNLDPRSPRAALVEWQITYHGDSVFALESAIYNRLKEILGQTPVIYPVNGSDLTLTEQETESLAAIKPASAGSHDLSFVETRIFAGCRPWPRHSRQAGFHPAWSGHGFE